MIAPPANTSRILDALPVEDAPERSLRIHTPPPPLRPTGYDSAEPPAAGGVKPLAFLKYHWMSVVFLGGFLGTILAYLAWTLVPSKYTTTSLVRVSPENPIVYFQENPAGRNDFTTYLKTQAGVFRTHLVLHAALREPGIADLPMIRAQVDPVKFLEEELQIETQDGSELIKLKLSGEDPKAISQIVNAIQRVYFREIIEKELTLKKARLRELTDAIQSKQKEIKDKREQLSKTKPPSPLAENTDPFANLTASLAAGQLVRFQEMLLNLDNGMKLREQEKISLEKRLENKDEEAILPPPGFAEQLDKDQHLAPMVARAERLQKKYDYLKELNQDNPELEDLKKQIQEIEEQRDKYKEKKIAEYRHNQLPLIERKLKTDLERCTMEIFNLRAQKVQSEKVVKEYQVSLAGRGENSDVPVDFLRVQIRKGEETVTNMIAKEDLLRLEIKAPPRVTEFQAAAVPQKKETKKQILATVMAGLVGFALIGLLAVAYEARVKRAMSLADVQRTILGPMLGIIPSTSNRGENPAEAVEEAITKLRSGIVQQFSRPGTKVIVMTSALRDEGRTAIAPELARSFLHAGSRTLLIDFDLRTPALHQMANISNDFGLCDVLQGEKNVADVVHLSEDGLMLLPAGRWTAAVRSALQIERLELFFDGLRSQCDTIIVNTHPVLNVAETSLIAQFADSILLCVEKYESRLPMVNRAHERIASLAPESIGIVFLGASEDECLS